MIQEKSTPKNLTLITTHVNADFDALASMLAAQKLYPEALAIFPGSQERNLRNFFIESMVYLFNMGDIRQIDLSMVTRLVLVDTRQHGRIGALSSLVDRGDVEIHIYDHHPSMDNDIAGHQEVIRPTGATTTILTEIIQEKGIEISPDEATVMCLGIYEDTGSFTFSSTTGNDLMAAAYLLSRGANLNIVSDLIARDISPEQISVLNDLIQSASRYFINGTEIVITSITSENYINEFSYVVHKMVQMENINTIFALATMGSKSYIVARSRVPEVDVAEILSPFGGGGHSYAAAASVKNMPVTQIEKQLLDLLNEKVRPKRLARDFMSTPPISVRPDVPCKQAADMLTRYNINALLVMDPSNAHERLVGYITRQVIEKALFHKLDAIPVKEYMTSDIVTVGLDAPLSEIQESIIENKQRILPVMENDKIEGVITRTDLLNILVRQTNHTLGNFRDPHRESIQPRTRNIIKFMKERLSNRLLEMLETIGEAARDTGVSAYVVGGFVRDLFLFRKNEDVDIVIEGDGVTFAKAYAKTNGARVHTHEKFGTAVIIFKDGFKVDVASARMEYYKFPAAMPTVEMSSIKLDLFRRDFTINTLAIHLNPSRFGTLIDFFAAQRDIKDQVIRALHNLSFVEDPTRIFRAIRFEQRFDFSIGKLTSNLIENAVNMDFFKRLSGRRVFTELRLILQEDNPVPAITRLHEYNLLKTIHPSIRLTKDIIEDLNEVKNVLSWFDLLFLEESYMKWAVYFIVMVRQFDRSTTLEICKQLEVPPQYQALVLKERFEAEACLKWLEKNVPVINSVLYENMAGFKTELILSLMAVTKKEAVKRAVSYYFSHLRYIKPLIRGSDLQKMGVSPGPVYSEIIRAVHHAKLNGQLNTIEDEMAFAKSFRSLNQAGEG